MKILRLIVVCGMLLLFSSNAFAADIFRVWHGVGIQGTQSEWSTEIDLTKPAPKVIYPSLKCGGEWRLLGVENNVYRFREVITVGREICIDGFVRVYLLNKKRMAVEYFESEGGEAIAKSVVFPGPHHDDSKDFMINVTRKFIASSAK